MDSQLFHLQAKLKRYLRRFLERSEDIEDIAQESFVRVLEAGSKGEIAYPKAYLYRTACNLALNAIGRKAYRLENSIEDLFASDVISEGPSLEDQVSAQRRFERFCHAVSELPEQCRKTLVLRKVYGYSQREVAETLGISISTVEKHLAKGLLRSAQFLDAHEKNDHASSVAHCESKYQSNT